MADTAQCVTHGDAQWAAVCTHLTRDSFGLGFNRNEPTDDDPTPDAWCDNCEIIRAQHDGWNEESEKLAQIKAICAGCYETIRIRNTRTETTLSELDNLRWKCGSCEEWHYGPLLDISFNHPDSWGEEHEREWKLKKLLPRFGRTPKTFLDEDYCATDGEYFFVRGVIRLPIVGTDQHFCWGVWGSLKKENWEKLRELDESEERVELPPMFSWLNNDIPEYPDTLAIKMYAHIQPLGQRPWFELEPTDHPLSVEYHHGISPERVKDISLRRLKAEMA
jgi:hypothetical protein